MNVEPLRRSAAGALLAEVSPASSGGCGRRSTWPVAFPGGGRVKGDVMDIEALRRFAAGTRLADVPDDVVRHARLLLLDTLGALAGGLRYPEVAALAGALDGEVSPIVTLGAAATWLDADSGGSMHPQGHRLPPVPTGHPAPHVLPVLLLAASDLDDERLLEIFLVAVEAGLRLSVVSALRPGFHPHGIHGPAAAALASALVHDPQGSTAAEAFLLGASLPFATALEVPVRGGTVRNLWTGLGAYYGARAGAWARAGLTASTRGVTALYDQAVATGFDRQALTDGLGERWEILHSYLKPYPCARWVHPVLDALTTALEETPGPAETITELTIETFAFAASLDDADPSSDLHARFSVPYCAAALACDGVLDAGSFLPEGLARQEVRDLARTVRMVEVPEYTAALPRRRPARVTVRRADGTHATAEVTNARGNPDTPLSEAEIAEKFRRNAGDRLTAEVVTALTSRRPGRVLAAAAAQLTERG
ncbi:MmgE/PrpD family protein [Actinomadura sp. DC4]|uniref:MmgE/PrpD family protein n=1 Tax=Actinomadura sp. DC4 TaxID=3055069 RepID=UPI0025B0C255|nr:MmgE/PrpD family protein [Actinomadura sp. DC4]MDN3356426.1 MmgE/PrpD family protein [Actinomadura sp. DC4]